ncbi:sensor histidine kinase [Nibrella viscosa]
MNFTSETNSFLAKVIGLFLCLTMILLGLLGFLLYGVGENYRNSQQPLFMLVLLIPLASLLIVLVFPLFFRRNLLRPLEAVLSGVQQVNEGNLTVEVPVEVRDEIGFLTQNFNQMTESLRQSKAELTQYAETLENKVAERTQELKQSLDTLKAIQSQLIQKEKMASLGELTAGIAHEIQNPLNFVNNFAEVSIEMTQELDESVQRGDIAAVHGFTAELRENMGYIVENGQRAASIVRSMLEHSRSSTGERRPTDLNELADEYLKLAYHGMRAKDPDFEVQLCTEFEGELKPVTVAPQDIGRVLLNLYNNAFYAVREKAGAVRRVGPGEGSAGGAYQPLVSVSTHTEGDSVELRVKDNGTGIPPEIVNKIYQPFFTTKPTGQGTGLGLSLSYDIVTKGHGGEMQVESREGEGTSFVVQLPL